jgi:putative phosphoesterase
MTVVGIISDTHGLLRPEALLALRGSDHILHAGDVGPPDILERLREIAPVTAVRGNADTDAWADGLALTAILTVVAGRVVYMIHDRSHLALYPPPDDAAAVVFGHSHQALIERQDGVLFLNPGSAGPRRFRLPVTMARLHISADKIEPEIVQLPIG